MDNKDSAKVNIEDTEVKVADTSGTAKKSSLVKIRLVKSHIHEGIPYEKGDFVEVDESSAKYIIDTAEAGVKV